MAIKVEHEGEDAGPPYENCCFWDKKTPYWTKIARRKPGAQVACCQSCAKIRLVREVPTKEAWCDEVGEKRKTGVIKPPGTRHWGGLGL